MNLLIVEDEAILADSLQRGLTEAGYSVSIVGDGEAALTEIRAHGYDLVLLDWRLPKKSGIDVCRELRSEGNHTLIMMLTALDSIENKVDGLKSGADDYLTKPFAFQELTARIHALLRRSISLPQTMFTIDDLVVNTLTRTVRRGGQSIGLSSKEFALLEYFLRNVNTVISRQQIAQQVWNIDSPTGTNIIDVYVNFLRQKLDIGSRRQLIHTVYRSGYLLKAPST
jgi:two-component system, OmpR family, copper resistance phosphate regulon response regulator CusR